MIGRERVLTSSSARRRAMRRGLSETDSAMMSTATFTSPRRSSRTTSTMWSGSPSSSTSRWAAEANCTQAGVSSGSMGITLRSSAVNAAAMAALRETTSTSRSVSSNPDAPAAIHAWAQHDDTAKQDHSGRVPPFWSPVSEPFRERVRIRPGRLAELVRIVRITRRPIGPSARLTGAAGNYLIGRMCQPAATVATTRARRSGRRHRCAPRRTEPTAGNPIAAASSGASHGRSVS